MEADYSASFTEQWPLGRQGFTFSDLCCLFITDYFMDLLELNSIAYIWLSASLKLL